MDLTTGTRWISAGCTTEVIVVRGAPGSPSLACGGVEMLAVGRDRPLPPRPAEDPATLIGKRYTSGEGGMEVLCTRSGCGQLTLDGVPLVTKGAKPLPASD